MIKASIICKNMNHSRIMVHIQFCPTCGQKFNVQTDIKYCTDTSHDERRKNRAVYCCDCGTRLSTL